MMETFFYSKINNIVEVFNQSTKATDCQKSVDNILEAYQSPLLSTAAKTAEITAQSVFIATQVTEFMYKDNILVAPILNSINGVADAVKIGVHAYVYEENLKETVIEIGKKTLSHSAEALANLVKQPAFSNITALKATSVVLTAASTLITIKTKYQSAMHKVHTKSKLTY